MFLLSLLTSLSFLWSAHTASIEQLVETTNGSKIILRETLIPGFVNSPIYRGTTDILWTCIVTIFACVYSCIHLHVPAPGTSQWRRFWQKARWASVTLVAPEMVLSAALRQYLMARRVVRRLNKISVQEHKDYENEADVGFLQTNDTKPIFKQESKSTPIFTLSYGFLVIMGGLSISTSNLHSKVSQITLTEDGVELLARNGHFITIADDEITNRSKANLLGKALICIQVLWMAIQCLARAISGYPLALLEIHTMFHVLCAIVIYLLWWQKPLDVTMPIVVDATSFQDIVALILMSTRVSGQHAETEQLVYRNPTASSTVDRISQDQPISADTASQQSVVDEIDGEHTTSRLQDHRVNGSESFTLQYGDCLPCGLIWEPGDKAPTTLKPIDIKRWQLCAEALCKDPIYNDPSRPTELGTDKSGNKGDSRGFYRKRSSSALIDGVSDTIAGFPFHLYKIKELMNTSQRPKISMLFMISIFPMAYGGIHFAALRFPFPSWLEGILWQIACITVMATTPAAVIVWYWKWVRRWVLELPILLYIKMAWRYPGIWHDKIHDVWLHAEHRMDGWLRGVLFVFVFCLQALARIFIMVETFVSLRDSPLGVYVTISWLQSIPHL